MVEFVGLLNDLQICENDINYGFEWLKILLSTIQCSVEPQSLSHSYWELLLKFAVHWSGRPIFRAHDSHVVMALDSCKEWDKLKCWIGIIWMIWPPEGGETGEEDLKHIMLSLSHQKPGAIQELEKQMEQWSSEWPWVNISESFQQICQQIYDNTAQRSVL